MESFNSTSQLTGPYKENSTNLIYNWLFCDNIAWFKNSSQSSTLYPWDILFAEKINVPGLQKIINNTELETRARILACNQLLANGYKTGQKELLAVIVEVGLDGGLDVLASYKDGTARYINQTGKLIIWETSDENSDRLIKELFANSISIINQIGPWNGARRPYPANSMARISFLVSDGLYFGEASMDALFNEPIAKPALLSATVLMQYLTEKVLDTVAD